MKITKKQWIIGVSAAGLLALGGAGLAFHEVQVQAQKQEQAAQKAAYSNLVHKADKAVELAETFKAEADVTAARTAIEKLKKADQTELNVRLGTVSKNWVALKNAETKVASAEKTKTDASVASAQKAIDGLKDKQLSSKKATFQKRLDVVKKTIKDKVAKAKADKEKAAAEAAKKAEAEKAAASKAETTSNQAAEANPTPSVATEGSDNNAPAPSNDSGASGYVPPVDNGGGNNTPSNPEPTPSPSTPAPPTGGGNSSGGNGGGGTPPPPPATTYTGWVKNKAGQIVWSQGGFPTLDAAGNAAGNWLNANATSGGWSCGAY